MAVRLFTEEDVADQAAQHPDVPEGRADEAVAAACRAAEDGLSAEFLEAYWAEVDRLLAQAAGRMERQA